MLVIANSAALARALDSPIHPTLKSLLALRRDQLMLDGFGEIGDIARYVVVNSGDALAAIETEIGIPIATNIVGASQYPDPDFQPNWEWCVCHDAVCWEAVFILSDDGFGSVLIVMEQAGVDPTLLALCRTYGQKGRTAQPTVK